MLGEDGLLHIDRHALLNKAADTDRSIRRLKLLSKGLKHAALFPASNHLECTKFQQILKTYSRARSEKS